MNMHLCAFFCAFGYTYVHCVKYDLLTKRFPNINRQLSEGTTEFGYPLFPNTWSEVVNDANWIHLQECLLCLPRGDCWNKLSPPEWNGSWRYQRYVAMCLAMFM